MNEQQLVLSLFLTPGAERSRDLSLVEGVGLIVWASNSAATFMKRALKNARRTCPKAFASFADTEQRANSALHSRRMGQGELALLVGTHASLGTPARRNRRESGDME